MKSATFTAALVLVLAGFTAAAQPSPSPDKELAKLAYFSGSWAGKGAFSSGRPIEAEVSFTQELDGKGLVYRHTDRSPNTFKALSVWSFNTELRQYVSVMSDNFGGGRVLVSPGWQADTLTLEQVPLLAQSPPVKQRFRFQKVTATSFRMTCERDKGDGKGWQLGDYLVFTRRK